MSRRWCVCRPCTLAALIGVLVALRGINKREAVARLERLAAKSSRKRA